MGLSENLGLAQRAVWYTQSKMHIGATNRMEAVYSMGLSTLCVLATRSVKIATPVHSSLQSWLVELAAKSEPTGCGNCGEQAAVAFVYLYQNLKAKPLDFMVRNFDIRNHAFVVIGRRNDSVVNDFRTWGKDAVVCDPWDGKAYSFLDIPQKMPGWGTFLPEVWHRAS